MQIKAKLIGCAVMAISVLVSLNLGASPLIGAGKPVAAEAEVDSLTKVTLHFTAWLAKSKTLDASLSPQMPEQEKADPNDALRLPEYVVKVPFSIKAAHFSTFKVGAWKLPRPSFNSSCYLVDGARILVTQVNQKEQNLLGELIYPSEASRGELPQLCADGEQPSDKNCKSGKPRSACPNKETIYIDLSSIHDQRDRSEVQDYLFNSLSAPESD